MLSPSLQLTILSLNPREWGGLNREGGGLLQNLTAKEGAY